MPTNVQENPERMISLEELAILANTNMITDDAAVERMRNHQKVQWDPSTDLYSYKVCASDQTRLSPDSA
jgi:hypothetical protein